MKKWWRVTEVNVSIIFKLCFVTHPLGDPVTWALYSFFSPSQPDVVIFGCTSALLLCTSLKAIFTFIVFSFFWAEIYFLQLGIRSHIEKDRTRTVVEAFNASFFVAYFALLISLSEFDVVFITCEHIAYNYFQFCSVLKFQVYISHHSSEHTIVNV